MAAKNDEALRLEALRLAVGCGATTAEGIVPLAQGFLAFLSGIAAPTATVAAEPNTEGNVKQTATLTADANAPTSDASTTSPASDTTADDTASLMGDSADVYDGDINKLKTKCMALGQRAKEDNGGPDKLAEQFAKFGAKNFTAVPEDKHAELYANLIAAGV